MAYFVRLSGLGVAIAPLWLLGWIPPLALGPGHHAFGLYRLVELLTVDVVIHFLLAHLLHEGVLGILRGMSLSVDAYRRLLSHQVFRRCWPRFLPYFLFSSQIGWHPVTHLLAAQHERVRRLSAWRNVAHPLFNLIFRGRAGRSLLRGSSRPHVSVRLSAETSWASFIWLVGARHCSPYARARDKLVIAKLIGVERSSFYRPSLLENAKLLLIQDLRIWKWLVQFPETLGAHYLLTHHKRVRLSSIWLLLALDISHGVPTLPHHRAGLVPFLTRLLLNLVLGDGSRPLASLHVALRILVIKNW